MGSQRGLTLSAETKLRAKMPSLFGFYRNGRRKGRMKHREPREESTRGKVQVAYGTEEGAVRFPCGL